MGRGLAGSQTQQRHGCTPPARRVPLCSWSCPGASPSKPGPEPPGSHRTHPSLPSMGTPWWSGRPGPPETSPSQPPLPTFPPCLPEAACLPEPPGLRASRRPCWLTVLSIALCCSRSSGQIALTAHLAGGHPQPGGPSARISAPGPWHSCSHSFGIYVSHSPSPVSFDSNFSTCPQVKPTPCPLSVP